MTEEKYNATSDHRLMENAQGDLERIKLVQTGVGIGKPEPVAYMNPDDLCADTAFRWCEINEFTKPLYTTPPQRTWVGLTDEEITQVMMIGLGVRESIETALDKLMEKNQ